MFPTIPVATEGLNGARHPLPSRRTPPGAHSTWNSNSGFARFFISARRKASNNLIPFFAFSYQQKQDWRLEISKAPSHEDFQTN